MDILRLCHSIFIAVLRKVYIYDDTNQLIDGLIDENDRLKFIIERIDKKIHFYFEEKKVYPFVSPTCLSSLFRTIPISSSYIVAHINATLKMSTSIKISSLFSLF